jgi:hypothetical protein
MSWEAYLDGVETGEWGDHICIMAAANLYNVAIGIVSSQRTGMQVLQPNVGDVGTRQIFVGHEYELHYIRLESVSPNQHIAISESSPSTQQSSPSIQKSLSSTRQSSPSVQQSLSSTHQSSSSIQKSSSSAQQSISSTQQSISSAQESSSSIQKSLSSGLKSLSSTQQSSSSAH